MAKHKYIETPEKMYELFEAYVAHVEANPRTKNVYGGKDFDKQVDQLKTPLTLVGFYNYCRKNASAVHHYFEDSDKRYEDYRGICRAIKDEIRQDQIEGGMCGQYNQSITQRLQGLKEQVEQTNIEQPLFGEDE